MNGLKISVNGKIVDRREAVVSVYDLGFLYGLGLFETFRTYDGRPFLLERHLDRLNDGCRVLGIPHTADYESVGEQIARLLEVNGLKDAYIRYSVSAGAQDVGLPQTLPEQPTVVIYVKPLSLVREWYEKGRPVQILRTVRPLPETSRRLKSFQYMNGWLAKRELSGCAWAREAEGVQLNERSELTEGIVSNIFFVRDGVLCTPSLATGVLPGVTRDYVLRLSAHLGIRSAEGGYRLDDLLDADEIFLTSSIQEIVPVREVFLPDGKVGKRLTQIPGPVTARLMNRYGEPV